MSLNYRDLFVVNKQRPHPVISHFQLNQKKVDPLIDHSSCE